jgi:hypothetical protein
MKCSFTCPFISDIKISSPYLIGWESTERFGLEEEEKKTNNHILFKFYFTFE